MQIINAGAQPSDDKLRQIALLEQQQFIDAWQQQAILAQLTQFGAGVLLAQDHDELVGYCIYQVVFETAEIHRIAVAKTHARQGIAVAMIENLSQYAALSGAHNLLLEVRCDNLPAIALYHKMGFVQIDVRKGYYKTAEHAIDALILQKTLV